VLMCVCRNIRHTELEAEFRRGDSPPGPGFADGTPLKRALHGALASNSLYTIHSALLPFLSISSTFLFFFCITICQRISPAFHEIDCIATVGLGHTGVVAFPPFCSLLWRFPGACCFRLGRGGGSSMDCVLRCGSGVVVYVDGN
jgi:hypothetical protein